MERIASATDVPCEVSTSTWRSLATICSGVCLLLAISVLLPGSKAIPKARPLQWGRITSLSVRLRPLHGAPAKESDASPQQQNGQSRAKIMGVREQTGQ